MPRRPTLEFWYEFASTYSYLSAMRIDALADAAGVEVRWRPFLVGPIFAAQGWNSSPFNLYPAKGRNMWRDVEREAARIGLPPVTRPDPFPQNSLSATRAATYGMDHDWLVPFSKAVYEAEFARGQSIAEPPAVVALLNGLGLDGTIILKQAASETNKGRLRVNGEEARSRGIFGAPTFLTGDGELFWGNDRLEQALAWAAGDRPGAMRE
ncbi:disulfide bond formation protein DsbA [Methylobacterium sp. Leaf469]|jgi:2-hydroxychromene-2-carboxylate isomerase|uniref:2-hydroxychromene-2-carboxylate isomerase n=1 Tax=unclassified Methylobacterium TaxID=2615210 RepID=UPI0007016BFD|nr:MULTISPECIES: 2-hydroxychromene-2-carboxylate isomerase [unclassified Methylobacterium]KQO71316.1 disulfide bond formation protein DsbA [Methylobacterium sp. Leaf87]KQP24600.1 disulfide bond formation protein DsbA [Methylobacterium sp. Leaf102]KQT93170.1 disulfide bond formation protein DsbA [Methylobacterium sp. Leaf469]USU30897.1 2-hydroxychromene-2-carboxylate isomerase [Methylobacterium sp. OTU13CASTA1]